MESVPHPAACQLFLPMGMILRSVVGVVCLLLACALVARATAAHSQRIATVDDVLALVSISEVQISPDGTEVLYVTGRRNLAENLAQLDIWAVAIAGGAPRQLTHHPGRDDMPRWSPDGKQVAFLSDRSGESQIWLMPAGGGEPAQLTVLPDGVQRFAWSPDGRAIAFIGLEPRPGETERLIRERWLPIVVDGDTRHAALWVVNASSFSVPRQLTTSRYHVTGFDWSPDGSRLTFTAAPSAAPADVDRASIFVIPAQGGEVRRVAGLDAGALDPRWSPDGRSILFLSRGDRRPGPGIKSLYLVPVEGGQVRNLTESFDESPTFLAWSRISGTVLFAAPQRTYRHIFAVPQRQITVGEYVYGSISVDAIFQNVAFTREAPGEPVEVYVAEKGVVSDARPLTTLNPHLREIALGIQETVAWTNSAGHEVEGILIKPVAYRTNERYPLLVVLNGGNEVVETNGFILTRSAYPIQVFAGRGFAVLLVNHRGSAGYGELWRTASAVQPGIELDDVMTGIDAMIARGIADEQRLGIMGWGYGGYLTSLAITETERFRAASVGGITSDPRSVSLSGSYSGLPSWEDLGSYTRGWGGFEIGTVTTATLIQHGERDPRAPAAHGLEFYRVLREARVPATLVLYPGQGHEVTEPRLQRDLLERNVEWFERWLLAEAAVTSQ